MVHVCIYLRQSVLSSAAPLTPLVPLFYRCPYAWPMASFTNQLGCTLYLLMTMMGMELFKHLIVLTFRQDLLCEFLTSIWSMIHDIAVHHSESNCPTRGAAFKPWGEVPLPGGCCSPCSIWESYRKTLRSLEWGTWVAHFDPQQLRHGAS